MLIHDVGYGVGFSGKQKNESIMSMDQQDWKNATCSQ